MATQGPPRKRPSKATEAAVTGSAESSATTSAEDSVEDAAVVLQDPEAVKNQSEQADSTPAPDPEPSAPESDLPERAPMPEQEAPKAEPVAQSAAPTVVKSSPGFVPLVLGGVVAAGLGFALARYVVPEGWPLPGASPLQSQITGQAADIADLRATLQALPKDDTAGAGLAAFETELSAVRETAASALQAAEAATTAISDAAGSATAGEDFGPRLAAIEERLTALESRPMSNAGVDPAALSGLTADIASLRSEVEAQKSAAATAAAQAESARMATEAEAETTLLKAALTKVEAAMNSGAAFSEPLALLSGSGIAMPAVLSENAEAGVPTIAALAEGFAAPARAALATSLRGDMGSTWTERFGSFLRSQTGARSLTPREGNDPDAILSRANAAVAAGDLQTALTEIAALPEAAQTVLAPWVDQVKLRMAAQTATAELAAALSER